MDIKRGFMAYIGIDVGGTKVQGIVFHKGEILKEIKELTKKTKPELETQIIRIIEELIEHNNRIKGIGLCFPGSCDREKGVVLLMPNLPKIKNFAIADVLRKRFKKKVKIENDGNVMALAECLWGEGKGKKNVLSLTLGTGIGGGIVVDNKIYIGGSNAAEVGHINIYPNGYKCTCGSRGCLEEYASGRAVMRLAKKYKLKAKDPKEVEDLARNGNKIALKVYKEIGFYLGVGIASLIVVLDPEIVTLAGSLSHAYDLFSDVLKKEIDYKVFFKHCEVKVSKLKSAPAVGAASLFLK